MKRAFTLLLITSLALAATAQDIRYLDEIFDEVEVTTMVHSTNSTVLQIGTAGRTLPQPLPIDIYQPIGDTEEDRPVMLVFHTGNFLPHGVNQQITGTYKDNAIVDICTGLAKRGYVAASVDYRLGWDPTQPTQPARALGIIQAAYRGVQDGRAAVRFMRGSAVDGNPFRIDPDKISIFGNGTGGYITLGMIGLTDYNEIINTTNGEFKFLLDAVDASTGMAGMDGVPETPMVIEAFHGDIEGKNLTVTPAPFPPLPAGDTTNYPNHVLDVNGNEISSDVALGINIGGAIGDISWLLDNTTPMITIQSVEDEFAPYNDRVLTVPGSMLNVVQVQGAQQIGAAQVTNGANDILRSAVFDDPITQMAIDNSAAKGHDYYEGVFPWSMPANSNGLDEGVAIDWWDPEALSPPFPGLGEAWNVQLHPAGMGVLTYNDVALLRNENMSQTKANANLDMCMQYILPRACVALGLPCAEEFLGDNTENLLDESLVAVSPNPASSELLIRSTDKAFQEIELTDMQGRLVNKISGLNNTTYEMDGLTAKGMHVLTIRFEKGIVTKKIILE